MLLIYTAALLRVMPFGLVLCVQVTGVSWRETSHWFLVGKLRCLDGDFTLGLDMETWLSSIQAIGNSLWLLFVLAATISRFLTILIIDQSLLFPAFSSFSLLSESKVGVFVFQNNMRCSFGLCFSIIFWHLCNKWLIDLIKLKQRKYFCSAWPFSCQFNVL